jgi:hypothetical protein
MEQLHKMFESADDANAQGQFMLAMMMFTAAYICATDDAEIIDRETAMYVGALTRLIKLHHIDIAKMRSGRYDA